MFPTKNIDVEQAVLGQENITLIVQKYKVWGKCPSQYLKRLFET